MLAGYFRNLASKVMAALKMLTNAVLNSGQAGRNDSVLEHFSNTNNKTLALTNKVILLALYLILFLVFNTFRMDFMQFLQTAHKLSI